jgi:hypothetical protein
MTYRDRAAYLVLFVICVGIVVYRARVHFIRVSTGNYLAEVCPVRLTENIFIGDFTEVIKGIARLKKQIDALEESFDEE